MRARVAFASAMLAAGLSGSPAAAGPATAAVAAAPTDAATLLARLRKVEGVQAEYVEEKHIALLAEPLVSRGTVHFRRPGLLARIQREPEAARVLIDGRSLRFADRAGEDRIDLRDNPVLKAFTDTFVRVLAGDAAGLSELYALRYVPAEAGRWTLVLTPRKPPLSRALTAVTIHGHDVVLDRIDVDEAGGDRTRLRFSDVVVGRRYTEAEWARIFRLRDGA